MLLLHWGATCAAGSSSNCDCLQSSPVLPCTALCFTYCTSTVTTVHEVDASGTVEQYSGASTFTAYCTAPLYLEATRIVTDAQGGQNVLCYGFSGCGSHRCDWDTPEAGLR
jgi:hypothetical protein